MARSQKKEIMPKLLLEIQMLEKEIRVVSNKQDISNMEHTKQVAVLTAQVRGLKLNQVKQTKAKLRAQHHIEGERPTKYWTGLHRETKPWNIIYALERDGKTLPDGSPQFETNSEAMANMAREYHMNLQKDDNTERTAEQSEDDITMVLNAIN